METEQRDTDPETLDAAIEVLTSRLPATWVAERISTGGDSEPRDLVIKGPNNSSQTVVLVEARSEVSARDVQVLLGGPWKRWRKQMGYPMLLIAPYIGPRVRELLTEENVSYIDLTGNIRVSVENMSVFIETQGAQRDPSGTKLRRGLRGAKVGAVVRALVDATPPYTGAEIARVAQVNEGYVSRILDTLSDEGIIERESFGPVTGVDWPAMLRRRAQVLDLFKQPGSFSYVARQGVRQVLEDLRARPQEQSGPTITGSFAAVRLAPVTAATLLVVYTTAPRELAESLGLLPADAGADTVLVRPDNDVVFARSTLDEGLRWAAVSQVAIDCLAGNGRMPAEGEAVIGWMRENEDQWRSPTIKDLSPSSEGDKE